LLSIGLSAFGRSQPGRQCQMKNAALMHLVERNEKCRPKACTG
jgi:hypothetical protein